MKKNIKDLATYINPHQFSTGMRSVFVNGQMVLSDGKPTNTFPGRVVYGPGKKLL